MLQWICWKNRRFLAPLLFWIRILFFTMYMPKLVVHFMRPELATVSNSQKLELMYSGSNKGYSGWSPNGLGILKLPFKIVNSELITLHHLMTEDTRIYSKGEALANVVLIFLKSHHNKIFDLLWAKKDDL